MILFQLKMAVSNLVRNRKLSFPFILSSALSVMIFYLVSSLQSNPQLPGLAGAEQMKMMLSFGLVVVGLFVVIFLFYTNSFLLKRRKKEFGLFAILGMSRINLAGVLFWELVIMLLISLLMGIAFGLVLEKGMFLIIVRMLNAELSVHFFLSPSSIALTVVVFCMIYGVLFLYYLFSLSQSRAVELLASESQGQKEPRARWFLSLAGILCLGSGYWLSAAIENPLGAFSMFFIAVILVIAGTYLLFYAGSIALLKLMEKNKTYYYKTRHFITISSMKYRMQANAVSLANICILSTMVLVALSSTICLWTGVNEIISVRYPRQVEVSTYQKPDQALMDFRQAMETSEIAAENILCYQTYSFTVPVVNGEASHFGQRDLDLLSNLVSFCCITLEDYNTNMHTNLTLDENQVYYYAPVKNLDSQTLKIADFTWQIKGRLDQGINDGEFGVLTDYVVLLILGSQQTYLDLYESVNSLIPGGIDNRKTTLAFDVPEGQARADADKISMILHEQYGYDLPLKEEIKAEAYPEFYSVFGGLLFVGVFISILFGIACVLIMYYKQISEGFEDQKRFEIMRKVGLDEEEIKKTIRFQVLCVFFIPLLAAGIHICFAFPMISRLLKLFAMNNTNLFILCTLLVFAAFALLYCIVYGLTSKAYYDLIRKTSLA